jgi:large subunit ribosomal protein L10
VLTRAQKETQVQELRERFGRAHSVFVADYRGLDVQSVNDLRRKLRSEGGGQYEYHVTKNTLLRRAVEGTGVASLEPSFVGPTAIAFSFGDPVGLAKVLVDYAKQHEVFEVKAGWLEGRAIGREEIADLATLPSLEELRARLVGLLQAPATQLARLLVAPAGQLARLTEARRAQLAESGGGA